MRALPCCLPLLLLGLAGCGAVPGSSSYGCGGLPEGVSCMSAREVYKLTDGGKPVVALPGQPTALDAAPATTGNPASAGAGPAAGSPPPASATFPRQPLPATGQVQTIALRPEDAGAADIVPLRTPSRVLRVWIAPWEDTSGRLHVPGYTYAEIEPRRWSIGEAAAAGGLQLKPLTPRLPPPPAPPETPPPLQAREPELQDAAATPPRRRQPNPPPQRRQADDTTQAVGFDQGYFAPP